MANCENVCSFKGPNINISLFNPTSARTFSEDFSLEVLILK